MSDDPQMSVSYEGQYQALLKGATVEEFRKKGINVVALTYDSTEILKTFAARVGIFLDAAHRVVRPKPATHGKGEHAAEKAHRPRRRSLAAAHDGAPLLERQRIAVHQAQVAAYKAPRHLVVVDTIGRAPNGKVDYKRLKGVAFERLAIQQ